MKNGNKNDIIDDILEEVGNYKAKIRLSDKFADLKGICEFDESSNPVEIRDMIREKKNYDFFLLDLFVSNDSLAIKVNNVHVLDGAFCKLNADFIRSF